MAASPCFLNFLLGGLKSGNEKFGTVPRQIFDSKNESRDSVKVTDVGVEVVARLVD